MGDDDVIFSLGEQRVRLPRIDANEIYGRLVELSAGWAGLRSQLTRALTAESARRVVDLDEEMRQELLRCVEAIEADPAGRMSEALRELGQAADRPVSR